MSTSGVIQLIDSEISLMKQERDLCGWSRKELACSLVRHRIGRLGGFQEVDLYDETAVYATDQVVNGIMGAMYPQDSDWFEFTPWGYKIKVSSDNRKNQAISVSKTPNTEKQTRDKKERGRIDSGDYMSLDDVEGAKDTIQEITRHILTIWHACGYYQAKQEQVQDAYVLGFGAMMGVHEPTADVKYWYRTFNPRECYIRMNNAGTFPEIFAREYRMTTADLCIRYGDGVPEYIAQERRSSINTTYVVKEFFCPAGWLKDEDGNVLGPKKKKIQHYVYVSYGESFIQPNVPASMARMNNDDAIGYMLEENGFTEMPISVLWFKRSPDHPYGVGVVESCVDEILKLNSLEKARMSAIDYLGNPMWGNPLTNPMSFKPRPGLIVPVTSNEQVPVPLTSGKDYASLTVEHDSLVSKIQKMLWVNIFQTLLQNNDTRKTALEVGYLKNEAAQVGIGMIGNSMQCVDREARRMALSLLRCKAIEVKDRRILVLFDQCIVRFNTQFINQIQNFYMISGITTFTNYLSSVYPLDQTVVDVIDLDQTTRDVASGLSMNEFNIREMSEVKQRRADRSELAMRQYQAQLAMQNSQTNLNNARANGNAAGGQTI